MDFRDVSLGAGNLEGADLFRADLRGAHLVHANLRGARMQETLLATAHLPYACFDKSHFLQADLHLADLHKASFVVTCPLTPHR